MSPGDLSDTDSLRKVLSSPPFVIVEGIINIREVGGYPTAQPGHIVKQSYLFRSGEPSRVTDAGKQHLRSLGVKKVFDFRSEVEIARYNTPTPTIDGVEFVRAPVSDSEAYDPVGLAARVKRFGTNELEAFIMLYTEILHTGGPAFEKVLIHIRDYPEDPCLVHCTAGKDRTGVFAALVLKLLGVDNEDIAKEYSLTTIGLQPALPMLVARFQKDPVFRDNMEATMKMAGAKSETIVAVLQAIDEKHGGVEGYLRTYTSLRDEDFDRIRQNLVIQSSAL
ncbi:hypothetical protein JAAARDRAFT_32025 [Jaapia argillacea MUCL 33604]|uniref:Tyrosine specific protein phosphatases domain-containing protein n=1 Tax=Jaapia argillacea MUCL 33604 TaxID=933084 RepID=A0A067QC07_9AGAM|nr:hypothetical protein JAAARDRAFT_32025 [Jaapia argillacea MUCL 33604]